MRRTSFCLAFLALAASAFPQTRRADAGRAVQSKVPLTVALSSPTSPQEVLTPEQKKAAKRAEKLRKKFPLFLSVSESASARMGTVQIATVGWCQGNLSWIFCTNQPVNVDGGTRTFIAGALDANSFPDALLLSCPFGLFSHCSKLFPGTYPARLGSRWISPRPLYVLANIDGKMETVTFAIDGPLSAFLEGRK